MPDGWHAGGLTVEQELSKPTLERQPATRLETLGHIMSRVNDRLPKSAIAEPP